MKKSEILSEDLKKLTAEVDSILDTKVRALHKEGNTIEIERIYQDEINPRRERIRDIEWDIYKEKNREIEVGDGVTIVMWSDRNACTVIKRTKTTMTVKRDKAILDPDFKPVFIPGGFAGTVINSEEQSYTYERDPNGKEETYYWSEKNGRWQRGDTGCHLARGRHEYYDYNF